MSNPAVIPHPLSFPHIGDAGPRLGVTVLPGDPRVANHHARLTGRTVASHLHHTARGAVVINGKGGNDEMRRTPWTGEACQWVGSAWQAQLTVALADGVVSEAEREVLDLLRLASYTTAMADWSRRARQSVENIGSVSPRLAREYRELQAEYPECSARYRTGQDEAWFAQTG